MASRYARKSGNGAVGYATKHMNTSSTVYDGQIHMPIRIARETIRRPAESSLSGVCGESSGELAVMDVNLSRVANRDFGAMH